MFDVWFYNKNDSAWKAVSNTAVAPSDDNRKWSVIRRHCLAALAPSSPCAAAVYFCGRICVIWWLQAGVRLSVSGVGVVYLSMFRSLFSTVLWRLARPAAAALESGCCSCGESSRMLFFVLSQRLLYIIWFLWVTSVSGDSINIAPTPVVVGWRFWT